MLQLHFSIGDHVGTVLDWTLSGLLDVFLWPIDKISSWLGKMPGTMEEQHAVCVCFQVSLSASVYILRYNPVVVLSGSAAIVAATPIKCVRHAGAMLDWTLSGLLYVFASECVCQFVFRQCIS